MLSAKTKSSLEHLVQSYLFYLEHNEERIEDICYTAAIGRSHFNHRLALIVDSKEDLLEQLRAPTLIYNEVVSSEELIESFDLKVLCLRFLEGKRCDWAAYYKPYLGALRKVGLPTYCFDTQRYWIESTQQTRKIALNKEGEFLGVAIAREGNNQYYNKFTEKQLIYKFEGSKHFFQKIINLNLTQLLQLLINKKNSILSDIHFNRIDIKQNIQDIETTFFISNNKISSEFSLVLRYSVSEEWIPAVKGQCKNKIKSFPRRFEIEKLIEHLGVKPDQKYPEGSSYLNKPIFLMKLEHHIDLMEISYLIQAIPEFLNAANDEVYLSAINEIIYCGNLNDIKWMHVIHNDTTFDCSFLDTNGCEQIRFNAISFLKSTYLHKALIETKLLNNYREDYLKIIYESIPNAGNAILHIAENDNPKNILNTSSHNSLLVYHFKNNLIKLVDFLKTIRQYNFNKLIIVISNGYFIENTKTINPFMRQVVGLWRVFRHEHLDIESYLVDLELDSQLNIILGLIENNQSHERELIVRHNNLYVPRLAKEEYSFTPQKISFNPQKTYLITGATGGLGFKLLHYLLERNANHLIICSRNKLNRQQQKAINLLETNYKASIKHCAANVSQIDQMKQVIQSVDTLYPLDGVFHLAGSIKDGMFDSLSQEDFEVVLQPKVDGAAILDQLTNQLNLSYFVLFSSISSLVGTPGQANYAAANAFMDGLVHQRRLNKLNALSINLGPVEQVGMAKDIVMKDFMHKITLEDINLVLDYCLLNNMSQYGLLNIDEGKIPYIQDLYFEEFINNRPSINLKEIIANKTLQEKEQILLEEIIESLQETTQDDKLTVSHLTQIYELGIDSIMQMEFFNSLLLKFESIKKIDLKNLINCKTIKDIIDYIIEDKVSLKEQNFIELNNLDYQSLDRLNLSENNIVYFDEEYLAVVFTQKESPDLLKLIIASRVEQFKNINVYHGAEEDQFDSEYHHLALFQRNSYSLVGALRVGIINDLYTSNKNFYTELEFKFHKRAIPILQNCAEISRLFYMPGEYNLYNVISLLFNVARIFLKKFDYVKYVIGSVTIPNNTPAEESQLLIHYLLQNHVSEVLYNLAIPLKPYNEKIDVKIKKIIEVNQPRSLFHLQELVKEHMGMLIEIPILFKLYEDSGMKYVCFGYDESFDNVIDGLALFPLKD